MNTTPTLMQANLLLREGRYAEACQMFEALVAIQPGFLPYVQGYVLARRRLSKSGTSCNSAMSANRLVDAIHPGSNPIETTQHRLFTVITPVLNGDAFIATTIESILSQQGDFFIDYLIKDAGSTDQTISIALEYQERVRAGEYPLRCSGIRFRVVSKPDKGLYDGLKFAFETTPWRNDPEKTIQTYLNADDVMHPNAFQIVSHVFESTPAQWVCGQTHIIDASGKEIVTPLFPLSFAQEDIVAGLHDGRSLYTIQQEGTFWLQSLYQSVGGIDSTFKLAGDFDLWRRFASRCELLALDKPLASFRSHPMQLSKKIDLYQQEVNKSIADISIPTPSSEKWLQFYIHAKAPKKAFQQKPGPVGFLDASGKLREIAYIKRSWYGW
jgi:hypothetical protein